MTELERIAALEANMIDMRGDVAEIKGDVKTLVARDNKQKGMAALGVLIWTAVIAGIGFLANRH